MDDRQKINNALDRMAEDTDIVWKGPFACCQTCGKYELEQDHPEKKFIFWHDQSDDTAFGYDDPRDDGDEYIQFGPGKSDYLIGPLYMYFNYLDAAEQAKTYLTEAGFKVEWNGSEEEAVMVHRG